ncbi:MAG: aldehyde ferredoxin oxidoreductase family protein [Nitrososphaerales archaeon]|nr:aldehyde ferredoxin oxidoreductase family protein [Nitrososphaerales archaeon]
MGNGYVGKIARIDLSKSIIREERIPDSILRMYIGGSGLGAKILYDETGAGTDPFSPENRLIFMTGPLTGTKVPLSGRHQVVSKSPLTGIYGEADVGGFWGAELKKAGYDGLIIQGKAEKPTYIWICDGSITLRNAEHLWGMDTYDLDEVLKKETDGKAVVASIGPAGERLARIAAIMHDGKDARAAARCGLGAVMGSKNLKAIVVRGSGEVSVADEEGLMKSIKELSPMIIQNTKSLHNFGTSGATMAIEKVGDLPIKNWVKGKWEEGAQKICGQRMAETILTGRFYCAACIIGCGRRVKIDKGPYAPVDGAGPEYETVAGLGAMCLIDNLEAIAKGNELCNRYGLDTISTGAVIALAMEAYERGAISKKDTDGIELTWGNADAMVKMVEKIGKREGFGWLLGEGVKRVGEKISGISDAVLHVKGLELSFHDPRAYNSVAVGYATSNRGACHLQAFSHIFERNATMPEIGYPEIQDRFGIDGKGEFVAKLQNVMSMMDSLKLCKFLFFGGIKITHIIQWIRFVTGWDMSVEEFMKTGERIFNLKRMYNVRCGISKKDDTLPLRILTLKRGEGGAADNLPPLERMLKQYYQYRGWDDQGIPKAEKLLELGITT